MVCGGIGFHYHSSLVRIVGTLKSHRYVSEVLELVILPYIHRLPSAIFQQDNVRPHLEHNVQEFLPIKFNCFLDLSILSFYRQSKTCGPCLHNDWSGIHPPLLHQINYGNMWNSHGLLHPQGHMQSLLDFLPKTIRPIDLKFGRRVPFMQFGRGSRVVYVSDRGLPCHEFEPSTTEDPPCRAAMHVKSVKSRIVLPLVWCGS
ncbi:hypothetical protein TNCV_1780301 [Trichonephila clavipes]|nr:hypothetical protein TNCV_1780301 [Trichonephila clavipes]